MLRPPLARLNSFVKAAGAQEGETVLMSWVEWPDKVARDAGMAKVTSDPRMQFDGQAPVFDGLRLIAGGFVPMLKSANQRQRRKAAAKVRMYGCNRTFKSSSTECLAYWGTSMYGHWCRT